jgi:hypothetical protein
MIGSYQPPAVDFTVTGSFQAWLTRIRESLPRHLQYLRDYISGQVLPSLNTQLFGVGPDIASAATINPTNFIHRVTGSVTVNTINPPQGFAGQLCLMARDGFPLGTTGNISVAAPLTVHAGEGLLLTYHPWYNLWLPVLFIGGGGVTDAHFKGYASGPPGSGAFLVGDYFLNSVPASAAPEGWVCVTSPLTFRTKGLIGDT